LIQLIAYIILNVHSYHLTRLIQKRDRISRQQLGIWLEEITSKGVLRHILSEVPTKRSMLIGEQLPTNNQWMILRLQNPKTMVTSFSGGRSRSTRREPPTMGK
jgi:hypothetical protein